MPAEAPNTPHSCLLTTIVHCTVPTLGIELHACSQLFFDTLGPFRLFFVPLGLMLPGACYVRNFFRKAAHVCFAFSPSYLRLK